VYVWLVCGRVAAGVMCACVSACVVHEVGVILCGACGTCDECDACGKACGTSNECGTCGECDTCGKACGTSNECGTCGECDTCGKACVVNVVNGARWRVCVW
jgi:hypothetical protein